MWHKDKNKVTEAERWWVEKKTWWTLVFTQGSWSQQLILLDFLVLMTAVREFSWRRLFSGCLLRILTWWLGPVHKHLLSNVQYYCWHFVPYRRIAYWLTGFMNLKLMPMFVLTIRDSWLFSCQVLHTLVSSIGKIGHNSHAWNLLWMANCSD